jgi:hypothetical protein
MNKTHLLMRINLLTFCVHIRFVILINYGDYRE